MKDVRVALELATPKAGERCVLIGCQETELMKSLAETGAEIYAVDNDENTLTKIRELGLPNIVPHYSRLVERIVHLPSNYFHIAVVAYRLERVEQRRAMLTEVNRLLTLGGRALILARLRGVFRRGGIRKDELDTLISSSPLKLLEKRKFGNVVALLLERVRPPA